MKVLILGVLLVSLYCIEGAVVKREAEGEGQAPEEPTQPDPVLAQYFPGLAEFFKKDTFTEYAAQARAFIQQVQSRLVNEQVTERIGQAFTDMIESAKRAIQ